MAEIFPAELQDKFNEAGFKLELGNTSIQSSVDVGLPKVRQRYTQAIDAMAGTIELNRTDFSILDSFYKITLSGGTKTFSFMHPITQIQSEFRFVNPPSLSPLGGDYFRVSFSWIEIP